MRVVVTDYIEEDLQWETDQLAGLGAGLVAHQLKDAGPDELVEAIGDADVVVVNMALLNRQVLEGLPNCRLVIRHGAGYDNVDVAAAAELGIRVGRVPDYCVAEVAEQALLLVLACRRRLLDQLEATGRSRDAAAWDFEGVGPVHRLRGGIAAVVGCGRIGTAMMEQCRGLGMEVLAVDRDPSRLDSLPDGAVPATLDEALQRADVVSLHVPLDDQTRALIGERELGLMQSTAVLVNTSRGAVVDLAALDEALRAGRPGAAGIDVYDVEPPPNTLPLLDNPNALCTPHLGWFSEEATFEIRRLIVEDVRRHLDGRPPRHPVMP